MLHEVPVEKLGPMGPPMAEAIQACVHCGFCLAACPTYRELGQEMDSPRGRIILMKEVLEEKLSLEEAAPHIDRCLGCLACEPACPSGVPYRDLISPFRTLTESRRRRSPLEKLRRWGLLQTLPYPKRFYFASQLGQVGKRLGALIPRSLRTMLDLMPDKAPSKPRAYPKVSPAKGGEPRARVALLLGCAQQVLAPEINEATLALLTHHGVEAIIPPEQGCCGALAWHVGDGKRARQQARQNLKAFPIDRVDAIITNAAGCGSGLHEYPLMLREEMDAARLEEFAGKVMDVTVFLHRLGIAPPETSFKRKVAYQDACHLNHGQGVQSEPRQLLRQCPGLELMEIPDAHLCCGSAGSYNLDQPEIAAALGREKAAHLAETGCDMVATGNIGCLMQLRLHLDQLGHGIPVVHTTQLLAEAYGCLKVEGKS